MSIYYVDNGLDENGDHLIHEESCSELPDEMDRTYLGEFVDEIEALESCKRNCYLNSNGCSICCSDAHRDI